ncbi:Cytochrome b-c1 complex subunit 6 [Phytophthora nicotianae]|uniref:Cytochrome b-c1 complex subunit 6 n=1 Tax=Phytophthora nicotianae TaxID=4792 RepID=A0A0W8CPK4_PHYNI|nr:Cytochrome b-c1 complex subunit 6 [Phytophthora nicotianae]
MSDEEPVDVMPAIRKACEPKCEQSFNAYQACLDRVKAKGVGSCDGQYFDFLHCIDKCVRPCCSRNRLMKFLG